MVMAEKVKPGTKVALASGRAAIVLKFLDHGSQGDCYFALLEGQKVCLKLFNPTGCSLEQRKFLVKYASAGRPSKHVVDLLDLVPSQMRGVPAGYVMELLDLTKLRGVTSLLERKTLPSLTKLVDLGIIFARAQRQIHAAGYGYHDYSDGNIKWDFEIGDNFRQLDIDNMVPQGVALRIQGTPGYIAPEVGRKTSTPSVLTDAFGISVCLFKLLHGGLSPLHGRAALRHRILTPKVRKLLEIANPCFVYDPQRKWNRPSRTYHGRLICLWRPLPTFMKSLFTRSFTSGLLTPELRVTDSEWVNAFVRLRGLIEKCTKCSNEYFVEPKSTDPNVTTAACPACKNRFKIGPRLSFGSHTEVVLRDGATLISSQVGSSKPTSEAGTVPVGRVEVSGGSNRTIAIENTSKDSWIVTDGAKKQIVGPTKKAVVRSGTLIYFPDASKEGVISFS